MTVGDFYSGTKRSWLAQGEWRPNSNLSLAPSYRFNDVNLVEGSFDRPIAMAQPDPISVAHRLISAQVTRSRWRSARMCSVTMPSPYVRAGSVPTIAAAANSTMVHP